MSDFKKLANINEIGVMAGGHPGKMAEYSALKHELNTIRQTHFNKEFPFVRGFREDHLKELEQYAKDNPEDESAQIRYNLQKERFAVQEAAKTAHVGINKTRSDLTQKYRSGEVTATDLKAAHLLAKRSPTEDNRVLYAGIKKLLSAAE